MVAQGGVVVIKDDLEDALPQPHRLCVHACGSRPEVLHADVQAEVHHASHRPAHTFPRGEVGGGAERADEWRGCPRLMRSCDERETRSRPQAARRFRSLRVELGRDPYCRNSFVSSGPPPTCKSTHDSRRLKGPRPDVRRAPSRRAPPHPYPECRHAPPPRSPPYAGPERPHAVA